MFAFMTIQEAAHNCISQLKKIYEEGEAVAISNLVMENVTGISPNSRLLQKQNLLTTEQEIKLNKIVHRLLTHEPVQYVLNEAWFAGFKFYVDKNVLIPRSETEELVEWIITNCKFPIDTLKILDIGSGSGCIPVILKRKLRRADIWSCDISKEAIEVAKRNAATLGTSVNFVQLDFLDKETWNQLPLFDIIVSNPPYIPERDKEQMQANILKYEPPTALFVSDNDPLIFYKAIAEFGKTHLNKPGHIYLEIHEMLGDAVTKLLEQNGYSTELKKDMQQKDRMLKAALSNEVKYHNKK